MDVFIGVERNDLLSQKLNKVLSKSNKKEEETFNEILTVYEDYLKLEKEIKEWDNSPQDSLNNIGKKYSKKEMFDFFTEAGKVSDEF